MWHDLIAIHQGRLAALSRPASGPPGGRKQTVARQKLGRSRGILDYMEAAK